MKKKQPSFSYGVSAPFKTPQPLSFQTSPGMRIHHELGRTIHHPREDHVAPNELKPSQLREPYGGNFLIYKCRISF